jgi:hypothetical protein
MKKLIAIAAVSSMVLMLAACAAPLTTKSPGPSESVSTDSATQDTNQDVGTFANPFNFGSMLANDEVEITLGKTEIGVDAIVHKANMFNADAPKGQLYVRVPVTIKNVGNDKVSPSSLEVSIIAATGESYSSALISGGSGGDPKTLDDVDALYHGGTGSGYVYFTVPKGIVPTAIYSVSWSYGSEVFVRAA